MRQVETVFEKIFVSYKHATEKKTFKTRVYWKETNTVKFRISGSLVSCDECYTKNIAGETKNQCLLPIEYQAECRAAFSCKCEPVRGLLPASHIRLPFQDETLLSLRDKEASRGRNIKQWRGESATEQRI